MLVGEVRLRQPAGATRSRYQRRRKRQRDPYFNL